MADHDFGGETQEDGANKGEVSGIRSLILLVLAPGGIREFDLPVSDCSIGRSSTAHVFIDHPSVSRVHAEVRPSASGPVLHDLASRNGTYVNEVRLGPAGVPLKLGDQIRFGNVTAQLHLVRRKRADIGNVVTPEAFDARIVEEAERCMRFERSLALIAIEIGPAPDLQVSNARSKIVETLRSLDVITVSAPGRLDVLVPESTKEHALKLARRLESTVEAEQLSVKLGVAVFPGDAPSPESLRVAAQLAMHAVHKGIGVAREAAPMLQVGSREVVVAEPTMVRLFGLIERAAGAPIPVLVTGETGSGKEIVAEALHALGPRAGRPMIKLNCAAFPENLLEAELFGYERGAFSGATAAKPGMFEQAEGGTLFLDEIAEMAPLVQAKLLRVLEDHTIRRVGAVKEKRIDVRVVAATNRDLNLEVAQGRFRQDLLYRLNALVLSVPPLRERRREIVLLAERFVAEFAKGSGHGAMALGPGVAAALESYRWPGNLRELRNVIGRAVVICEGNVLTLVHFSSEIGGAESLRHPAPYQEFDTQVTVKARMPQPTDRAAQSLDDELRGIERTRILEALEICHGNQTRAAEYLNMPRRTLVSKLAMLNIDGRRVRRT